MVTFGPKFGPFRDRFLSDFERDRNGDIDKDVSNLPDAQLFDPNEGELLRRLLERWRLRVPVIDFDGKTTDIVPANALPGSPARQQGAQQFVRYVFPVQGDIALLKLQPSQMHPIPDGQMLDDAIAFFLPDYGSPDALVSEATRLLDGLRFNAEKLTKELEQYNAGLVATVQNDVTQEQTRRRQNEQRNQNILKRLP